MCQRLESVIATILPDQDRASALAHIDLIATDEAGLAALDLWVDRIGALPPCKVTPADHDRLYADAEGKAAVRMMNKRVDAADHED